MDNNIDKEITELETRLQELKDIKSGGYVLSPTFHSGLGLIRNNKDIHFSKSLALAKESNLWAPTKPKAENLAKRIRSMKPTCPVPQDGEAIYVVYAGMSIGNELWASTKSNFTAYYAGSVFKTKEAAEAWVAEFGEVWTTHE